MPEKRVAPPSAPKPRLEAVPEKSRLDLARELWAAEKAKRAETIRLFKEAVEHQPLVNVVRAYGRKALVAEEFLEQATRGLDSQLGGDLAQARKAAEDLADICGAKLLGVGFTNGSAPWDGGKCEPMEQQLAFARADALREAFQLAQTLSALLDE
jgi:hypothetical protein